VTTPTRPLLRWHGGKWRLAPWIISFFGVHRVYTEPFGGGGSVLLRKDPAYSEVLNDLDGNLVNLFRVLRDERMAAELLRRLQLTPFAREEFNDAYIGRSRSRVERARRLLVRSYMGHGSDGASGVYRTGFRANSNRSGTTPAHDWANYPPCLEAVIERLRPVVIENRDALQVMRTHDSPVTLHYLDPPYPKGTRKRANRRPDNGGVYRHEMTDEQHRELLAALHDLAGMVIISGYHNEIYDELLGDWLRVEMNTHADGALDRVEVLWLNPAAQAACPQPGLFEAVVA
jgi:DNA adenine methylase